MPTDIRYKFNKNTTGAALATTAAFFAENLSNDGDGKQLKIVKRQLRTGDIGVNPGQIGHANGLILDVIPKTYNILFVMAFVFRKSSNDVGSTGMYPYDFQQGQIVHNEGAVTGQSNMISGVMPSDNSIRVIDKGVAGAPPAPLDVGDTICALVILGQAEDPLDLMNYA
jgi:hypothetical protein